ncbi:hypothetical protein Q5752_001575 [Cryptotrichosporon argae]
MAMDDKTLITVAEPRSPPLPPLPVSPAPAYSSLPDRETDYFCAPVVGGRLGDVELVSADGRRFLVHKHVLEAETVFFHIYYGFVPVWQLQQAEFARSTPPPPAGLNRLLCLPKFLSTLTRAAPAPSSSSSSSSSSSCGSIHSASDGDALDGGPPASPPPAFTDVPVRAEPRSAPAVPRDVTAPTPTRNPYTWTVPEPSTILLAFLSLVYPAQSVALTAEARAAFESVDALGRLARAALGYQAARALGAVRERLARLLPAHPLAVYATATFFKFADLAVLASAPAAAADPAAWGDAARTLMGRHGAARLLALRQARLAALAHILESNDLPADAHGVTCPRRPMADQLWEQTRRTVAEQLRPDSELVELLGADVRGGHCGDCLALVGATAQRCMLLARDVPRTI